MKVVDKRHEATVPIKKSGIHSSGMVKPQKFDLSWRKDGVIRVAFYVNHSGNSVDQDC